MKICAQCGSQYEKRSSEAYWQYRDRKFCSRTCSDLGQERLRVANEEFKARYRQVTTPDGRKMLEHRWVMEQVLGRPLRSDEHVHHKDHDGLNNNPSNLEVVTVEEHAQRHTWHPITKVCVICEVEFTPHKTKRARAQTCGKPECKSALLAKRWETRPRAARLVCVICDAAPATTNAQTCSPPCASRLRSQRARERYGKAGVS